MCPDIRGYPDQALQESEEALRLAYELAHPFSLAFALIYAAGVRQFRDEEHAAQPGAEAAIALSDEQGFLFFSARGKSVEGWALTQREQVEEGIALMRQSLAVYQTLGIKRGQPHVLAVLAEAGGKIGQIEEGLTLVARVHEIITGSDECWYEAELWRLKGELTLQKFQVSSFEFQVPSPKTRNQKLKTRNQSVAPDPQGEAEACFRKAIDIARQQAAKSLELRVVMSLVRLRQQQVLEHGARSGEHRAKNETAGKRESQKARKPELPPSLPASQHSSFRLAEAHRMLAEVYDWFTEGFDTKDLQEAQALLANPWGKRRKG